MTEKPPRAPQGLSKSSKGLWIALHAANFLELHEDVALERALRWLDVGDRLLEEAEKLKGRERSARLRSAADAAATGLKFFRVLRFDDPAHPARKPGRPPGKPWLTTAAVPMVRRLE